MATEGEFREKYLERIDVGEHEKSLDAAIQDGFDKLEKRGLRPPFRVVEILAEGTNPFSGYRVVMRGDS